MSESEDLTPPEQGLGDLYYGMARGGISAIPGVGGVIAELISSFIQSPLERRQVEWGKRIIGELEKLRESKRVNINELKNSEAFISIFLQAQLIAIKTHREEKLQALQNIILNSALGNKQSELAEEIDESEIRFVRFVDELGPSHLKLLTFMNGSESDLAHRVNASKF